MRTFALLVILTLAGRGSSAARQDASPGPIDSTGGRGSIYCFPAD